MANIRFNLEKKDEILDFFKLIREFKLDNIDYMLHKSMYYDGLEVEFSKEVFLNISNENEEVILIGNDAKKVNFLDKVIKIIENM